MKTLQEIHEGVPPNYYDKSIKSNFGQKIWHQSRFRTISEMLPSEAGKILDIGCHGGTFTGLIAAVTNTQEVYGIDISHKAIKFAKKRFPQFNFQVADAQNLPFGAKFFDGVTCLEVLEHVDEPEKVLLEIKRVLKKNGWALILVPTENTLFKFLWFFWTTFGRGRVWQHTHVQNFSGSVLDRLLKKTGFKVEENRYFLFNMLRAIRIRASK